MKINIVCTSKPCDGLLYYSYEYCHILNKNNIDANLIIINHRNFDQKVYLDSISKKYIHCKNVFFETTNVDIRDITLVMGRSMITLPFLDFNFYSEKQQNDLKTLFSKKIISVYSENHIYEYNKALLFFSPEKIVDLCDVEIYPNGIGEHFEKCIDFSIHKDIIYDIKYEYLFTGTNQKYYTSAEKFIKKFKNSGIIIYEFDKTIMNEENNHIFVPTENLLGKFNTYIYVKETFDPAPRLIQECKFYNKTVIYLRDSTINDGGKIYFNRKIKKPDINPILNAIKILNN